MKHIHAASSSSSDNSSSVTAFPTLFEALECPPCLADSRWKKLSHPSYSLARLARGASYEVPMGASLTFSYSPLMS